MRSSLVVSALFLAGCVAQWDTLVRYSPEPPPAGSLDAGIYREFARELRSEWRLDTVYLLLPLPDSSRARPSSAPVAGVIHDSHPEAPGYWSDTLRKEVDLALRHADATGQADRMEVESAFRGAGVIVVGCHEQRCPLPSLSLYRPGYNRDSTMAALRSALVCGMTCGNGSVTMYARRRDTAWRSWWSFLEWIS